MNKKQTVRLNESQLKRIVNESVKKVLNEEEYYNDFRKVFQKLEYMEEYIDVKDILSFVLARIGAYESMRILKDIEETEITPYMDEENVD